eukprot:217258_1
MLSLRSTIFMILLLITSSSDTFSTIFDGVWDIIHEDRTFHAYICSESENNIYLALSEIKQDPKGGNHLMRYTIGVSHFDKISESDKKVVIVSSDSYILGKRDDRNKNGYFESIFVIRYEKEEDETYIHFKLNKKDRPTNIKMIKDEDNDDYNKWACWIPPPKREISKINSYPQVWKASGYKYEQSDTLMMVRSKLKSGCWAWVDTENNIKKTEEGGYFSSFDFKYDDDNLVLFKWFDVSDKYMKGNDCKNGSGMFMIIGKWDFKYMGLLSMQCND